MVQTSLVCLKCISKVFVGLLRHNFFDERQLIFLDIIVQVDPKNPIVKAIATAEEPGIASIGVPNVGEDGSTVKYLSRFFACAAQIQSQ